jgi:putative membrane protein
MPENPRPPMTAEEFKLRLQVESALLIWVRTSLSLMGFGFVVARFGLFLREVAGIGAMKITAHPGLAIMNNITGTVMIVAGVVVMIASMHNYRQTLDRLDQGDLSPPSKWSLGVWLGVFVAILGIGMAVYLTIIEL